MERYGGKNCQTKTNKDVKGANRTVVKVYPSTREFRDLPQPFSNVPLSILLIR